MPRNALRIPLAAVASLLSLTGVAAFTQAQPAPAPAAAAASLLAPSGNRGPYEVAFTPNGALAVVTEFDEGMLALIEARSGQVLAHIPTGGTQPTGVAVTPDGKQALVTNSFSGSLAFVDLAARKAVTVPLPGAPWDVVISPDGSTAYVSVSQLDQVAVFDVAARREVGRIGVGRRPRALDITPDGRVVVTANLTQGSVSFIDTATRKEAGQGPTPAVNLRGVAVYPNGRRAYCVGQRAQNERPTETSVGIWSNQAFQVVPYGNSQGAVNIWLDFIGQEVAEPDSVVFDRQGQRAFITCTGGHSVNAMSLSGGDPVPIRGVGACPKGLSFTPDGRELWVANSLGNDLAVIDPSALKVVRRVSLGAATRKDPLLRGKFLFHTASITDGGQFSCASCHPDGNTDGISWKFVHVKDSFGREMDRNVKSLRGGLLDTAPFRWSGAEKTVEQFVTDEVSGLLHGPALSAADTRALVDYIESLPLPPNPYRKADGSLTESGARGKALFVGKAGCAECHTGPKAGGQRMAWIGTTPKGIDLDVPHLTGVYDSYPYLHHGKARTLEEIFTRYNEQQLHGKAHLLSEAEMLDLLDYVRQL